jgi:hypothetical protein
MINWIKALGMSLLLLANSACVIASPTSVEVQVVDQNGQPIKNAQVYARYRYRSKDELHEERTDENGEVSFLDASPIWIGVTVKKDGYYRSVVEAEGHKSSDLTITMREKKNPIPMFVKETTVFFPKKNTEIGYDLKVSDWMPPFGNGNRAHVFLLLEGYNKGISNMGAKLHVRFPHDKGGIQPVSYSSGGSDFDFPYKAPEKGYSTQITHEYKRGRDRYGDQKIKSSLDKGRLGYVFKIVSKVDKKGNMAEAKYGRINGEFQFSPVKNEEENSAGFVTFTYYLNPNPNDRNIEFDPQGNLFKDAERTYPP